MAILMFFLSGIEASKNSFGNKSNGNSYDNNAFGYHQNGIPKSY